MIDIFTVAKELNLKGKYVDRIYINSSGTQAFFICPFKHKDSSGIEYEEKVPSFTINIDTGKFYCFACGVFGTSIEELYRKLGKSYRHKKIEQSKVFEGPSNYTNGLFSKIHQSFSSINYDLIQRYLQKRNIQVDVGFIHFFGLNVIDYKGNEKLFVIREINHLENVISENTGYICRKFIVNDDIDLNVDGGKYLNISKNGGSFLYPYNWDSIKFLLGNGVVLVESIMDSLKLSSYRIKNMCTLGASIRKSHFEYLLSLNSFLLKYYLIPQNDEAGKSWLNSLIRFFQEKNILFEIITIPDEYKDLCEIQDGTFFQELKERILK